MHNKLTLNEAELSARETSVPPSEQDRNDFAVILIGGGLGSFALASRLRIGGVGPEDICVVSQTAWPDQAMAATCAAIGMRPDDTMRSDASARIDNLWGFPSYAVAEALKRRRVGPLLRVLGEPVLCQQYTPTLATVQAGVRREAERIGWAEMLVHGTADQIVTNPEGGYIVRVETASGVRILRAANIHLALGSSAPRVASEAQPFRDRTGRRDRVVHAHEPHDHVYEELASRGGDVLIRGAGITSSRVLQRLIDDRDESGMDVRITQEFRQYHHSLGGGRARVDAAWGFRHQAFDYPRSAYGGPLREELAQLPELDRYRRFADLSVESTPYRTQWARQLRRGRIEGWYQAVDGHVSAFGPRHDGVRVRFALSNGGTHEASFAYVIDCAATEADASRHPLIRDMLGRGLGSLNGMSGLRTDDDYAVVGADSGGGRIYATGVIASGADLGPMDSFLGVQSAALRVADQLASSGVGGRLTAVRSAAGWWRWVRGRAA